MEPEELQNPNFTPRYRILRSIAMLGRFGSPDQVVLVDVSWLVKNRLSAPEVTALIKRLEKRGVIEVEEEPEWELLEKYSPTASKCYAIRIKEGFPDYWRILQRAEFEERLFEVDKDPNSNLIRINHAPIAKTKFNSENDNLMDFLMRNQNRRVKRRTIETAGIRPSTFKAATHSMNFKGLLGQVFFRVHKTEVVFRNPIRRRNIVDWGFQVQEVERAVREAAEAFEQSQKGSNKVK